MPTYDEIATLCERLRAVLDSPSMHAIVPMTTLCRDAHTMLTSMMAKDEAPVEDKIQIGDVVRKESGDYTFDGVVVAAFDKLSGKRRYVVENDDGILHIFNAAVLKPNGKRIVLRDNDEPLKIEVHDFIRASRVFDGRDPLSERGSIFDLCYDVHCKTKGIDLVLECSSEWHNEFAPMVFKAVSTMKLQIMEALFGAWSQMATRNNALKRQNAALIALADKAWMSTIAYPWPQVCKHLIASNIISDMEDIGLTVPKVIARAVVQADDAIALTFDRATMGRLP